MIVCEICGHQNATGVTFCAKCSTGLSSRPGESIESLFQWWLDNAGPDTSARVRNVIGMGPGEARDVLEQLGLGTSMIDVISSGELPPSHFDVAPLYAECQDYLAAVGLPAVVCAQDPPGGSPATTDDPVRPWVYR